MNVSTAKRRFQALLESIVARKSLLIGAVIVALVALAFAVGWLTAPTRSGRQPAATVDRAADQSPHGSHAMHSAGAPASMRRLTVSREAKALMNIETARVERRYVTNTVRMVGKVAYDETRLKHVTAWISGRLDRMFIDFTGVEVKEGDHLVSIYSPELYAAQQELIEALRSSRERRGEPEFADVDLLAATRDKLRLLGLTKGQISEIEKQQRPTDHLIIYAPMGGTVIQKLRQQGDYVKTGERIYTLADLSRVWVMLDAYESDHLWLRYGQKVTFTTEAWPGEEFSGRISFLDPVLNERTRTAKVRVDVPNRDGRLKPEMFAHAEVQARVATAGRVIDPYMVGKWLCRHHPEVIEEEPGKCRICGIELQTAETMGYFAPAPDDPGQPLVIPASAPLITGTRAIVYVEVPDAPQPTFVGREIVLGPRAGDFYLVRHGLEEGELVVIRGNFKIDSAVQIEAKPSMMTPEGGGTAGMHQHGGEQPKKTEKAEAPAMTVPVPFRKQLRQLDQAYQAVKTSVESGDLERVRLAFRLFGESLDSVESDLLEGHPRMQWNELKMVLVNDVVIGRKVDQDADAQRVFRSLRGHMQRLRKQLMMTHEDWGAAAAKQGGVKHPHE